MDTYTCYSSFCTTKMRWENEQITSSYTFCYSKTMTEVWTWFCDE